MQQQITSEEIKILKQDTLKKINNFLSNIEKKEDVFNWAKKIVVSSKYEKICKKDKTLGDAIQVLFELHHPDGKHDPTKEELNFYKSQLEKR